MAGPWGQPHKLPKIILRRYHVANPRDASKICRSNRPNEDTSFGYQLDSAEQSAFRAVCLRLRSILPKVLRWAIYSQLSENAPTILFIHPTTSRTVSRCY
ncbi:hypothetical protein PTI98_012769 [Pleurotus ostreatus]|nr:hypothetical protein PTI98_012769 [Pleurotus ostreatus]